MTKEMMDTIRQNLISEYHRLLDPSLEYLNENFENYSRICFANISSKEIPFSLDRESCIEFLENSGSDIGNLEFTQKDVPDKYWTNNNILFPFVFRKVKRPAWGSIESDRYRRWRDDLEVACQDEFLKADGKLKEITSLLQIPIFDENEYEPGKLAKNKSRTWFIFDVSRWLEFVGGLIEKYFPGYTYNSQFSNKKVKRYLQEIENGWLFGFECDVSSIQREIKRGTPTFEDYFNIVLINPSAKKTGSLFSFLKSDQDLITNLGMLGNPFFYEPCYPMRGYSAMDLSQKEEEGIFYSSSEVMLETGKVKVIPPTAYSDTMKIHACFFMDILASTSRIYLDYLKVVLANSL